MASSSLTNKSIKKTVFFALLEALNDIMGIDGRNSVLRYAKLEVYINACEMNNQSLDDTIPYETFQSLLSSMFTLLGFGTSAILFEAGRKWLIYLSPFGLPLNELSKKLETWIGGKWKYTKKDDNETIQINECPICYNFESITGKPFCHIVRGILSKIKESETGEKHDVIETKCIALHNDCCEFVIMRKDKIDMKGIMKDV